MGKFQCIDEGGKDSLSLSKRLVPAREARIRLRRLQTRKKLDLECRLTDGSKG